MKLILLELPGFLLLAGKGKKSFLISTAVFLILMAGLYFIRRKRNIPLRMKIDHPALAGTVNLFFSAVFYLRWNASQRIGTIAGLLHLTPKQACLFTAFFLALLALPGTGAFIKTVSSLLFGEKQNDGAYSGKVIPVLFIGLTALLMLFLNSRSSPFYAIDDWVDPNTMFTVGKGVLKGYVPYRDLYEQKGPMLVFIHTAGAVFSFTTLHGVWILQVISGVIFLLVIRKISALFAGKSSAFLVPVFAAFLYSSQTFGAGDTAEEFCLPLLAYAFYTGCKALLREDLPTDRDFLLIGVTSGLVFWIKYSITGFYLGWFLWFLLFSLPRRKTLRLLKGTVWIAAGVFLASIPVLAYFLICSSVDSLFEAYFYNNLFYYADRTTSFFRKMWFGLSYYWIHASVPLVISLLGLLWAAVGRKWKLLSFILLTYISAAVFLYIGGMVHGYSSLPLCIFSVFGVIGLADICSSSSAVREVLSSRFPEISAISLLAGLLILCGTSQNQRFLEYGREDWFQYKMKAVIESSGPENATVLHYHMGDAGVNTAAGLIPDIRFFCYYHNPKMTEIEEIQNACIRDRCADYIITQNRMEDSYPEFETYDHIGSFLGMAEDNYSFYHYYVPAGTIP